MSVRPSSLECKELTREWNFPVKGEEHKGVNCLRLRRIIRTLLNERLYSHPAEKGRGCQEDEEATQG